MIEQRLEKTSILDTLKSELAKTSTQKNAIETLAKYAKIFTGAQRCSLFIYKKEKDQLKSVYADGIKGSITLKSNIGIVGYAFHKKTSILENNTGQSGIFFKTVDAKTNYTTDTILAVPLLKESKRVGVLELLNKEGGFSQEDKVIIEAMSLLLLDTLMPTKSTSKKVKKEVSTLEEKFESYLDSRRLYLMENGSAYYKILHMKRDYFIAADQCYVLTQEVKTIDIYYHTGNEDFLSLKMLVKLDVNAEHILISESTNQEMFLPQTLEEDEETAS